MTIYFWRVKGEKYGCFSNFSGNGFILDGYFWKTSEHYYQAMKFTSGNFGEDNFKISTQKIKLDSGLQVLVFDHIRNQKGPMGAAKEGRRRDFKMRSDWELDDGKVKNEAMARALYAKFTQNQKIKDILLSTGDEELVENSPTDPYWGNGSNGKGRNQLGKELMILRGKLKK